MNKPLWKWFVFVITILVICTGAYFAGFPEPSEDDVFWISAPIEWAKNNTYNAPELNRVLCAYKTQEYLLTPPFYTYFLGLWIKLNGVSASSILLFQNICFAGSVLTAGLFLASMGVSWMWRILFVVALFGINLTFGMRPEPLSLTFIFGGLSVLAYSRGSFIRDVFSFIFLGVGCVLIPNTIPIAAFFCAAVLILRYRNTNGVMIFSLRKILVALGVAFLIVMTLFLMAIRFQIFEIIEQMLSASKYGANVPRTQAFHFWWWYMVQYWRPVTTLPIFVILAGCMFFALREKMNELPKILFWTSVFGVLIIIVYRPVLFSIQALVAWIGVVSFFSATRGKLKWKAIACVFLLGVCFLQNMLVITFVLNREKPSKEYFLFMKNKVSNIKGCLVVDDYAARYLFDFRLPPDTYPMHYLKPYPHHALSPLSKMGGDTWVVSTWRLGRYIPELQSDFPRLKAFGRTFNSYPQNPYEFTILPP